MQFEFTEEEANLILAALTMRPFGEVFQVVASLQKQARTQLAEKSESDTNG